MAHLPLKAASLLFPHPPWAACSIVFFVWAKTWHLTCGHRVWTRQRVPIVRAWATQAPRENLAAGKLLVAAEAAEHGQGVVCAFLDNDKCFEHREREQAAAVIATARVVQRADLLAEVVPHELGEALAITATSWSPETCFSHFLLG